MFQENFHLFPRVPDFVQCLLYLVIGWATRQQLQQFPQAFTQGKDTLKATHILKPY